MADEETKDGEIRENPIPQQSLPREVVSAIKETKDRYASVVVENFEMKTKIAYLQSRNKVLEKKYSDLVAVMKDPNCPNLAALAKHIEDIEDKSDVLAADLSEAELRMQTIGSIISEYFDMVPTDKIC